MEKLVSSWYNVRPVPEDYIYPPKKRPGDVLVPKGAGIPVIDISEAEKGDRRTLVIHNILKASQEFGFFQVVNHGVSENWMDETLSVMREFFQTPDEAEQNLYTQDFSSKCIYFTSCENMRTRRFICGETFCGTSVIPSTSGSISLKSPLRYRKIVGACSAGIKNLASTILRFFVTSSEDSVVEPAKGVVYELHPSVYKSFTPKDFYMRFFENDADTDATFNHFRA